MSRFFGKVGYQNTGTLVGGEWVPNITERDYNGKYLNLTSASSDDERVNPEITLQARISIVADKYALGNFSFIKYVIDENGVAWEVTSVEPVRPRLILSTGGVYDGPRPSEP